MFSRGSKGGAEGPVCVEIVLEGGQELQGRLVMPPGRTLPEVLNSASSFIEFQPMSGEHIFIAKSALHSVKPMEVPEVPDLWAGPTEGGSFDPFAVLGVKPGSTREEARDAYLGLAKTYHPDRYAAADLPREVREYLAIMARRVNAAYEALGNAQKRQAAKQEPVFTKAGQG